MAFDVDPICMKKRFEPNQTVVKDDIDLAFRDALNGVFSLQGLAENGDAEVTVEYSNWPELGWFPLYNFTLSMGELAHKPTNLPACRFLRITIVNKLNARNVISLVPCFV